MRVPEAAAQLGLPVPTVYALVRSGELGHIRVGKRTIVIEQSDIDDLKARGREKAKKSLPAPVYQLKYLGRSPN